ncbi:nucleotidyltransferase family protein, partial [candidate division WOR-3 bacterium]|nr:nucleotidyltransferase family protein [candidate division WOR-3 bacterium]
MSCVSRQQYGARYPRPVAAERTTARSPRSRRTEILAVARKHGARNVRIFGAVARGNTGPSSDVGILVELEPGRGLLEHAALLLELQRLPGCDVDVTTDRGLRPRIRDRVLREAVPLLPPAFSASPQPLAVRCRPLALALYDWFTYSTPLRRGILAQRAEVSRLSPIPHFEWGRTPHGSRSPAGNP